MKISAGILPYIEKNNEILVLLGHMGGPIYINVKECYGIIKGEIDDVSEEPVKAAIREFMEETTEAVDEKKLFLIGEAMQRNDKKNIIYGINEYYDTTNWNSNEFPLEWPSGSGKIEYFKEMDGYKWFNLIKAKELIRPTQRIILEMLEEKIRERSV
jgi:predicted NUDIX family NTP pyrophosphohydrolase